MKKTIFIILITFFICNSVVSQSNCGSAAAFCANQTATTFPAEVNNGSAAAGPDYGCLSSQPNPAWYFFQVSQSGSINIDIEGTGGGDVDFICWGPFTSQTTACNNLTAANTIDCSYSSSPTETCVIANATSGQYYMLLITNYSNQAQNIDFNQSSGTGSTNCGLLSSGVTSQTICPGATAVLIANSNLTNPTYAWNPGGATTSSISVSPASTTVYSVNISGINPSTGTPTVITNSGTVTVNSVPTLTLNSNSFVCQGSSISLTTNSGLTSYTWTGPGGYNQVTAAGSITRPNATIGMAGTYTVIGRTAQGCTVAVTNTVGVVQTSSITVVPTTSVCPGSSVFLTANTVPSATTYSWTGPSSFSSAVQNPTLTNVVPSQSGTYTVTAGFVGGATTCTITNTSQVTVQPLPIVTLTTNNQVCQGGDIKLNSSTGMASYTWTGPAALNQTTTSDSLVISNANISMQGTYTVLAQAISGCTATATASVEVIETGSVAVTPLLSACQGGTINLTSGSTPAATGYDWMGPGGYTSNNQNPVLVNVLPNQSGNYTVTASFTSGTVTCTMVNTSSVNVIAAPMFTLNPIPTVCNNANINLFAPNGGTSYIWTGPNAYNSVDQNPVIPNASVAHQGTYSVTVITNGCANKGAVNISVYPVLSFLSVPTGTTLCAGKTGVLSSNGSGGSGSYNYEWIPTTGLSAPNSQVTTVTGVSTTDYTLTLSDVNCPATLMPTTVAQVVVNPTPVITFTTSNNRGCEPFTTDLISNSVPASANCFWRFSDGTGVNSCNTPSFSLPLSGIYSASLTVIDINGCVDSVGQNAFIVVDPKPNPSFDYFPMDPTILINEVNYYDQSTVGLPMQNWHWDFGDYFLTNTVDTSNIQNPSHVYENTGTYTVSLEVTNSFGCKNNISRIVVIEDEFALYVPNAFSPTKQDGKNDEFKIQGMGFISDGFEMTIYDRWGSVVYKTNDPYKGWDGSIKGGALAKEGVYVYKIFLKDFKNREKEFLGHITVL